jgi:glycosyltransferase involved in cell wall biosynthesis
LKIIHATIFFATYESLTRGGPVGVIGRLLRLSNQEKSLPIDPFCAVFPNAEYISGAQDTTRARNGRVEYLWLYNTLKRVRQNEYLYLPLVVVSALVLWRRVWNLLRGFSRSQPTVIVCHDFFAALSLGFFAGNCPLVLVHHLVGSDVIHFGRKASSLPAQAFLLRPLGAFFGNLEALALRTAQILVFPSRGAFDLFRSQRPDLKTLLLRKNAEIAYNGVDQRFLDVRKRRAHRPHVEGNRIGVITVSKLYPSKGIMRLPEVMAELSRRGIRFNWIVVGEGVLKEQLLDRVQALGLGDSFSLIANASDQQLDELLTAAFCFILLHRDSVFDFVLLEALAAGVPVISTNVGGNAELIMHNQDGYLLANDDSRLPRLVADTVASLVRDRRVYDAIVRKSGDKAIEFSASATYRRYYEIAIEASAHRNSR